MLSSANCGRFLSKRYTHYRNKAIEDKTMFTQAEQDYLDISGVEGTEYYKRLTLELDTAPIGSTPIKTLPKKINKVDIRLLPQMGGSI